MCKFMSEIQFLIGRRHYEKLFSWAIATIVLRTEVGAGYSAVVRKQSIVQILVGFLLVVQLMMQIKFNFNNFISYGVCLPQLGSVRAVVMQRYIVQTIESILTISYRIDIVKKNIEISIYRYRFDIVSISAKRRRICCLFIGQCTIP